MQLHVGAAEINPKIGTRRLHVMAKGWQFNFTGT